MLCDACAWPVLEELIDLVSGIFNALERHKQPGSLSWVSAAPPHRENCLGLSCRSNTMSFVVKFLELWEVKAYFDSRVWLLLKYKLPSVTLELSWFFQALRAYLCLVLGLVLALQLWMCIKWIHFRIHLRFLHFWLLFWRSGFANKGIERKKGIQFLLLVPCSPPPPPAYKFILRSAFFSSLFKMSEFDLDLLAVTAGNGLWRKIWAWGWISARDAVCTWHSLRQILAWNEIQGATLCQDAECWGVGVRDLYD